MERIETESVSSEYLKRHKVSMAQLEHWQICSMTDAENPGIHWTELAKIANEVAMRWNQNDGQLANYGHFLKAVERKALVAYGKQETTRIIKKTSVLASASLPRIDEKEIDEKYATDWRNR